MDASPDPRDVGDAEEPEIRELGRLGRDCLVVGWSSFLISAVGTMLLFAWVDPADLADVMEPPLPIDRMTGYAIGFFFLWVLTAAAAAMSVYMIRTRTGHPRPPD
jgi:hypothetical protein